MKMLHFAQHFLNDGPWTTLTFDYLLQIPKCFRQTSPVRCALPAHLIKSVHIENNFQALLKRFLLQVIYYAYLYTVFHITNKSNNPLENTHNGTCFWIPSLRNIWTFVSRSDCYQSSLPLIFTSTSVWWRWLPRWWWLGPGTCSTTHTPYIELAGVLGQISQTFSFTLSRWDK